MNNEKVTSSEIVAAIQFTAAIGDAIRELGRIESGKLFAVILGAKPTTTATVFNRAVGILEKSGLVRRGERGADCGFLIWTGEGEASLANLETALRG